MKKLWIAFALVSELMMVWFVLTLRRVPSEDIIGAVEPAMGD